MRIHLEDDTGQELGSVPGDGADLVAFMSFAVVRGFGAQHPYVALSERLAANGVKLGPLTTFYEREPEDAEDKAKLELAWQDAAPLAESLRGAVSLLASDEQCRALVARAEGDALSAQVEALLPFLDISCKRGAKVRLTYDL
jgi:hypothetical protein